MKDVNYNMSLKDVLYTIVDGISEVVNPFKRKEYYSLNNSEADKLYTMRSKTLGYIGYATATALTGILFNFGPIAYGLSVFFAYKAYENYIKSRIQESIALGEEMALKNKKRGSH